MIQLLNVDNLNYPVLDIGQSPEEDTNSCRRCAAYAPDPRPDGELAVDPEIHLPSPGLDVDIAYFYSSNNPENSNFGYGRTLSTNLYFLLVQGHTEVVTIMRGNGAFAVFQRNAFSSEYVSVTPGVLNKLTSGSPDWLETTPDGRITAYANVPSSLVIQKFAVHYVQDAVGNRHTFTYNQSVAHEYLNTLQDTVGRTVSFSYDANNLLQSIQDWAGRRTTFAYDTNSVPGKPLLTTVTGPSGCQTVYSYTPTDPPLLKGITDPNGYLTSYTYSGGRVQMRQIAGAGITTYTYAADTTTVLDALGAVTTYILSPYWNINGVIDATGRQLAYARNANEQEIVRQNGLGARWTTSYDGSGNPVGKVNPLGYMSTITRDSFNNPTAVQYPDGAVTTLIWGYAGSTFDTTGTKRRLQASIDPLGNITTNTYNGRGQIATTKNPLGYVTTFGYDNFGNQVSVTDPLGNTTTRSYDLGGNVIGLSNPLGNTWTTAYDTQNRPTASIDPLGNTTTWAYDGVGNKLVEINPLGYRTSWTYNVFDKDVTRQDALGNVWTSVYDLVGQTISSVNPLGYRSTTVFDLSRRLLAAIDALCNVSTIGRDQAGQVTGNQNPLAYVSTSVYDIGGRQVASVDAAGSIWTNNYDSRQRLVSTIDPLGRSNTFVFDLASRPIARVDAAGYRTTSIYDVASRWIASIDARGYRTSLVYDYASRIIASVDALSNYTTFNFDSASRHVSVQNPLGYVRTTVFDVLDRVLATIDPLGFRLTSTFDLAGRVVEAVNAIGCRYTKIYDALDRTSASINPVGARTTFVHNGVSEQIAVQDPLGHFWTNAFDPEGQLVGTQNPLNYRSTAIYDALGRINGSIDSLNNRATTIFDSNNRVEAQQDARGYRTSFIFDVGGQLIAVQDANGGRTSYLYDSRGLPYANQDQLGAFTTYNFDQNGNISKRTDARNWVTTYSIDALNRTSGGLYHDGTRFTFSRDQAGRQITMQDVTGITTTGYDNVGRLTSVIQPMINRALTYTLDASGQRLGLLDIDSQRFTYFWDVNSRLTQIVNPYAETTTLSYDILNREQQRILANGISISHTYDVAGRETVLESRKNDGVALSVYSATYDAIGNRLSVGDLDGSRVTYGYDPTYQLTSENRSGANAFNYTMTYDAIGNRLTKTQGAQVTTYQFNAASELTLVQNPTGKPTTCTYDANGNLILDNTGGALTTYSWESENLLSRVDNSDGTSEQYSYSANGMREKKVVAGATVLFVRDGDNVLIETDGINVTQVRYTDLPGIWGGKYSLRRAGATRLYLPDNQGTTRQLTDISQATTDLYLTDAWGVELTNTGSTINPFRAFGQWGYFRDAPNKHYIGARHLYTSLGRWITRDPNGGTEDASIYTYVRNRPTAMADPSGLTGTPICPPQNVCGASINKTWLKEEVRHQLVTSGKLHLKDSEEYANYAFANQDYKDPPYVFTPKPLSQECGTGTCGSSVTLCGNCVHKSTLGDIMYGFVGCFKGFATDELIMRIIMLKTRNHVTVDPLDAEAYKLGCALYNENVQSGNIRRPQFIIRSMDKFCRIFAKNLKQFPDALSMTDPAGKKVGLSHCHLCMSETPETRHGKQ